MMITGGARSVRKASQWRQHLSRPPAGSVVYLLTTIFYYLFVCLPCSLWRHQVEDKARIVRGDGRAPLVRRRWERFTDLQSYTRQARWWGACAYLYLCVRVRAGEKWLWLSTRTGAMNDSLLRPRARDASTWTAFIAKRTSMTMTMTMGC